MKTVHLEMKKETNNFIIFISSLISTAAILNIMPRPAPCTYSGPHWFSKLGKLIRISINFFGHIHQALTRISLYGQNALLSMVIIMLLCVVLCTLTPVYSFYNQAHKKVQHLGESFAKMEDAYREACLMFSESPKNIDPTDFFCLFQNFIKEWKVSCRSKGINVCGCSVSNPSPCF